MHIIFKVTGLVDGNVARVLARLFAIGCDIASQNATDHLWYVTLSFRNICFKPMPIFCSFNVSDKEYKITVQ